jgi:hypothetical protein
MRWRRRVFLEPKMMANPDKQCFTATTTAPRHRDSGPRLVVADRRPDEGPVAPDQQRGRAEADAKLDRAPTSDQRAQAKEMIRRTS